MAPYEKPIIYIGNKKFKNVTNETCVGRVFTRYEAEVYGKTGEIICDSEEGGTK